MLFRNLKKIQIFAILILFLTLVFISGCIEQNGELGYFTASQVYEDELNNQYSYGDEVHIYGTVTTLDIVGGAGRMYLDNIDGLHLCYSMSEYYGSFEEGQIFHGVIKRSSSQFYWGIIEVE